MAGVIKMVMAMRHGVLPKTLHVDEPTSQVDWAQGEVRLLTESIQWPETGRPRRAGVSSFGVSGTNAHIILEQSILGQGLLEQGLWTGPFGPRDPGTGPTKRTPVLMRSIAQARRCHQQVGLKSPSALAVFGASSVVPWVVSGKSADAVRAQAARLAEFAEADPDLDPIDVGWSLASSRAVLLRPPDSRDGRRGGRNCSRACGRRRRDSQVRTLLITARSASSAAPRRGVAEPKCLITARGSPAARWRVPVPRMRRRAPVLRARRLG